MGGITVAPVHRLSFVVTRWTREIGVHWSLEPKRSATLWLVQRDALVMIVWGIAIGLLFVWSLGHLVTSQLYELKRKDPAAIPHGGLVAVTRAYNDEMRDESGKHTLMTIRSWATLVAAVPLAAQVTSTNPPAASTVTASAADGVRKVSEQLAQIDTPMSVEPAFTFHV